MFSMPAQNLSVDDDDVEDGDVESFQTRDLEDSQRYFLRPKLATRVYD